VRQFRLVEELLREQGRQPNSVWQLFYNGSVGSQAMVGMRRLHELLTDAILAPSSVVWPFQSGWTCPRRDKGPLIVHAEIWPGVIVVDDALHDTKDAAQMMSYVLWAARQDIGGTLAPYFEPLANWEGSAERRDEAQGHEGWILGFRP
jgi:hypothetical protein